MMYKKIGKKAISPLVATVIIIAITVAAGITLYAMVWPLLNNSIQQTSCTDITFELDSEASCSVYDVSSTEDEVRVSIDRTASSDSEPEIVAWKLTYGSGEGERRTVEIDVSVDTSWDIASGVQTTPTIDVDDSDLGGAGVRGNVNAIDIFPVIRSKQAQVDCPEVTRSIQNLLVCAN